MARLYGLRQNPFPQLGRAEWDETAINSLDGEPIRDIQDIAERLQGFSQEFIELCQRNFLPGERVSFQVVFPEEEKHNG